MDSEPLGLLLLEQMFLYRLPLKRRAFSRLKDLLKRYRREDTDVSDTDLARAAALLESLDLPLGQTSLQTLLETQHSDTFDSIDYMV